jgi:hypothetical protein
MGEERNVYRVLVEKPEGKRPLERPRHRWEDGIRVGVREIGWGSVDCIQSAEDRDRLRVLVNTVMKLRVLTSRRCSCISTLSFGLWWLSLNLSLLSQRMCALIEQGMVAVVVRT